MEGPKSCDTFVVLGDKSQDGGVIFGKNSDRPNGEVQEIVFCPAVDHADGVKIKVTHGLEIDQAEHTHAVILSKPAWMWGAEMGSNEHGVCIGNEAIWTKLTADEPEETGKLLGMDLVRLGLERSKTAEEALNVITALLEKHGQGGNCTNDGEMTYSNSFLIADATEAWVLEAAGPSDSSEVWVAKKFTAGFTNISNCISIGTDYEKHSGNLKAAAAKLGWQDDGNPVDFKETFQAGKGGCEREEAGRKLLELHTKKGLMSFKDMMAILRYTEDQQTDKEWPKVSICMCYHDSFASASSQVSVISKTGKPSVHWFTGTPDPSVSLFKPFVFLKEMDNSFKLSDDVVSPEKSKDEKLRHTLYKLHERFVTSGAYMNQETSDNLHKMQEECIKELEDFLDNGSDLSELSTLFKDCVEAEIKMYE